MQFIDYVADLTPYDFLAWVLWQYFEEDAELPDLDGCVAACYKERGAETVDLFAVDDQYDGFITLQAGVQSVTLKPPPRWLYYFAEKVGVDAKAMNCRRDVCLALAEIIRDPVIILRRTGAT